MINDPFYERNIICFYEADDKYGYLSNWYPAEFEYAGKKYANVEQYMMYQKMMTFCQFDIAKKILETKDPEECKDLGRTPIKNWDGELWDKIRYQIVKRGVKAKFFQNKDLLEKLIQTGDALLAECSKKDDIWGIGIADKDPDRYNVGSWTGRNLLGRCLMEVREELRVLSEMPCVRLMERSYFDTYALPAIAEWKMEIRELLRVPKYRNTVSAYLEVCKWFTRNYSAPKDITEYTLAGIESMMKDNMGGGLPIMGFFELKQDFYEINMDMYIVASGIDASLIEAILRSNEEIVDGHLIRTKKHRKKE